MVEDTLGCSLDPSIKDFYKLSNGLQLKWIHKNTPEYDAIQHHYCEKGFDFLNPLEWYGCEDGCINILPLQLALVEQDWSDFVWSYADERYDIEFGGATHNLLEFRQRIKPLDLFSKSEAMAFLIEKHVSNPKVLPTQDHFAEATHSKITNLSSYLEFVLHHWGLVRERSKFYSVYGGHEQQMVYTPTAHWQERPRPDIEMLYF